MRARHGGWLVAVAVALAFSSAATAVAAVARVQSGAGPAAVVHRYFDALTRADAATALNLSDQLVTGPFLSTAVLDQQRALAPISQVHVRSVRAAGHGRKLVLVSYRLGFTGSARSSTDTVSLIARGRTWRLAQVAAEIRVLTPDRSWLTLAGAVLPQRALLFPGALPVHAAWAGLSIVNRPAVSFGASTVTVSTAVNARGRSLVAAGLRAALDTCLGTAALRCPTPAVARAVPGSMLGEIRTISPPVIELGPGGVLRVRATATVRAVYSVWDFDNVAQSRAGAVPVSLSAQCSVADLSTMYWQP